MTRYLLPLAALLSMLAFMEMGTRLDPRRIASPLIDKPLPALHLASLEHPEASFDPQTLRGKPWVLNVWASWCAACREEHETLMQFSSMDAAPLYGLNYKDGQAEARQWLTQAGNPYRASLFDGDGRAGLDLGVYGVPETFLIDSAGRVRFKHAGPLTEEILQKEFLPRLKALKG